MSTLYEKPDWSQKDLAVVTEPMKKEMFGRYQSIFSNEQLYYYKQEMEQRDADGLQVSLIDLWGLVIEHLIYGKVEQDLKYAQRHTHTHTHTHTDRHTYAHTHM